DIPHRTHTHTHTKTHTEPTCITPPCALERAHKCTNADTHTYRHKHTHTHTHTQTLGPLFRSMFCDRPSALSRTLLSNPPSCCLNYEESFWWRWCPPPSLSLYLCMCVWCCCWGVGFSA